MKNVKQKSMLEILDETVEYYRTHPRAVANGDCDYATLVNGEYAFCGVGRCLIDPIGLQKLIGNEPASAKNFDSVMEGFGFPEFGSLESQLKPEYRGHPVDFWQSLQAFHDSDGNWILYDGQNVLSGEGISEYNIKVNSIKKGLYKDEAQ